MQNLDLCKSGIYLIKNKSNNKVYVGSTGCFAIRFRDHKRYLERKNHKNNHLQNAWDVYGSYSFSFQILETIDLQINTVEFLVKREQYWIDQYNSLNHDFGYNLRDAGNNGSHSEESRQKMREAALGRKLSEDTKKKISEYGIKYWAENYEKMLESNLRVHKGKKVSDETKKKISEALTGRKRPLEVGIKSGQKQKGKVIPEETKEKMRIAQQRRRQKEKLSSSN